MSKSFSTDQAFISALFFFLLAIGCGKVDVQGAEDQNVPALAVPEKHQNHDRNTSTDGRQAAVVSETSQDAHFHTDSTSQVSEQHNPVIVASEVSSASPSTLTPVIPDDVNPTRNSTNPLFADGVPEHLQCPRKWVGVRPAEGEEALLEELGSKIGGILEEVQAKWNPNRPLPEVWHQMIDRRKHLLTTEVTLDMVIQEVLDFPEISVLMEEDFPRALNMLEVELGERDPDWNVAVLHDGRIFRMKANHHYRFRFTELMDVENGIMALKSYDLLGPVEPTGIQENVIIHLDHVTDEAFERLSGWDYNINPYTTGTYTRSEKNKQHTEVDAPVSPFGFGPYPKIPDDFRITPSWLDEVNDLAQRDLELIHRVLIKLWNHGDKKVTGGFLSNDGLFYPFYPNTVYVKYVEREQSVGSVERPWSLVTHGGNISDKARVLLLEGVIPPNVCVGFVSENNLAIDPYVYLRLE